MREIVVLSGAEADLLSIYCWMESLSTELADRFDAAVQESLTLLAAQPAMGPAFRESYRRLLVSDFHCFGIFYCLKAARGCVSPPFPTCGKIPGPSCVGSAWREWSFS